MARLSPTHPLADPVYVVQRHHATTLHYDLRLEVDGVLASWAVPKEPSLDPQVRRLAVRVDDHELAHATFEGRTPGTGGPGTVEIWDSGTWECTSPGSPAEALAAGHLSFVVHGRRLTGPFALLHRRLGGDDRTWLLVRKG